MKKKIGNRWLMLFICITINLFIGAGYAWSVFQKPLMENFGWNAAETSLAFSISFAIVPIAMMIFGPMQDKRGPKWITLIGGILFGLGAILTGFTSSLIWIYLSYGMLLGMGMGMVYGCTTATTVKWFPDKKGMAGGLTAAGFGSGAIFFAPIATFLIKNGGVLYAFRSIGILFIIVIPLLALFIDIPEKKEKTPEKISLGKNDYSSKEMLRSGKFYLLWAIYCIGCISGLMIIAFASPIGQEQIGLTPAVASLAVMVIALANTSGRIFWGMVSDKIGRYNSVILMFILSALMLILLKISTTFTMYLISVSLIALCFGGFLGTFPSITAENYGTAKLGSNYGITFTAFGVAAILAPRIAGSIREIGGSYEKAFIVSACLSIVGVVLTIIFKRIAKKRA